MIGTHRPSLAAVAVLGAALGAIFCPAPAAHADLGDQCLCEQTGGTWDPLSCGHYTCGAFPDCDAVIPGCDCGPGRTFVPGLGCLADPSCDPLGPVLVIVDMDAATPGVQRTVRVPACTRTVEDVAIYIIDPVEQRTVWSIGYRGALERGIAFGHAPTKGNAGAVTGIAGQPHTPINPDSTSAELIAPPFFDAGLAGPEVQYVESGAQAPAVIPSAPAGPIFTADISLDGAQPGDRFAFHLLDMVTVWSGGSGGAFSTIGPLATLDTGGDAVPDATISIYGVDPDPGVPAPPAAFFVDYIDGPPATGPGIIEVVTAPADIDGDGAIGFADLSALLAAWGPCPPSSPCPADLDGDGATTFADLTRLLGAWGGCE